VQVIETMKENPTMDDDEDRADLDYLRGKRAALTAMLAHVLRELGYEDTEATRAKWIRRLVRLKNLVAPPPARGPAGPGGHPVQPVIDAFEDRLRELAAPVDDSESSYWAKRTGPPIVWFRHDGHGFIAETATRATSIPRTTVPEALRELLGDFDVEDVAVLERNARRAALPATAGGLLVDPLAAPPAMPEGYEVKLAQPGSGLAPGQAFMVRRDPRTHNRQIVDFDSVDQVRAVALGMLAWADGQKAGGG
jgi:hypothetical protein